MVRLLILVLIVFAGLLVGPMLIDQKGYVLIAVNDWTVETSVVVLVMLILVFYALLQIFEWCLVNALTFWGRTRNWFGWRRQRAAREKTLASVLDLAQGDYLLAEQNSARNAQLSDKPLLNYLTAAQAAQRQGKSEQRDQYLERADELKGGKLAVQTTRLKLHIDAEEFDEALVWLKEQSEVTLSQKAILRYAHLVYLKLNSWDLLLPQLAALKKNGIIDADRAEELLIQCHRGLLKTAAEQSVDELKVYYRSLSRKLRSDIDVFTDYAQLLIERGGFKKVESELFKRLRKSIHAPLLMTLNAVDKADAEAVTEDVALLTRQHPQEVVTFDVAGRLSMKAEHWEKAKEWFNAAIAISPSRELYQNLAFTEHQLGQSSNALTNYQLAIEHKS